MLTSGEQICLTWALVACLGALAGPAAAAPRDDDAAVDKARKLVASANAHYNLGEYVAAEAQFQEAYRLKSDPALLFNIAQCERQSRKYEDAARSYRAFLRESPDLPEKNRATIRKLIADMDAAHSLELANRPPTGTRVADEPPPATATSTAAPTAPAETAVPPSAPPRWPWWKSPAGLGLGIGGVALVAVGGALLGVAASKGDAANRAGDIVAQRAAHADDLTFQQAGFPLLGVGCAALVSAAIVFGVEARK